jgi:integrase
MSRKELKDTTVRTAKPPAGKPKVLIRDTLARNLALQVTATANATGQTTYARSYVFIYKARKKITSTNGKSYFPARCMGLGSVQDVSLSEARENARTLRLQLLGGTDPMAARVARRPQGLHTLKVVAKEYYDAHRGEWSNPRYVKDWWTGLEKHISGPLGDWDVAQITTGDFLHVIRPLWQVSPKMANEIRGRLEKVWNSAKALKWVSGENPFLWRGNLDALLADVAKREIAHHPSLPYEQLPAFLADLDMDHVIACAVAFCIRTAVRSDAVIDARWPHINLTTGIWTVPAVNNKGTRGQRTEFKCPLSPRCIALLKSLPSYARRKEGGYVFTWEDGTRIGQNSMLEHIQVLGYVDPKQLDADGKPRVITMHGFRSTFTDWAYDSGNYPDSIIEMALQHAIKSNVVAAYRRGSAFNIRQSLMADWNNYCDRKKGGAMKPRLAT